MSVTKADAASVESVCRCLLDGHLDYREGEHPFHVEWINRLGPDGREETVAAELFFRGPKNEQGRPIKGAEVLEYAREAGLDVAAIDAAMISVVARALKAGTHPLAKCLRRVRISINVTLELLKARKPDFTGLRLLGPSVIIEINEHVPFTDADLGHILLFLHRAKKHQIALDDLPVSGEHSERRMAEFMDRLAWVKVDWKYFQDGLRQRWEQHSQELLLLLGPARARMGWPFPRRLARFQYDLVVEGIEEVHALPVEDVKREVASVARRAGRPILIQGRGVTWVEPRRWRAWIILAGVVTIIGLVLAFFGSWLPPGPRPTNPMLRDTAVVLDSPTLRRPIPAQSSSAPVSTPAENSPTLSMRPDSLAQMLAAAKEAQESFDPAEACRLYTELYRQLPDSLKILVDSLGLRQATRDYNKGHYEPAARGFTEAFRALHDRFPKGLL